MNIQRFTAPTTREAMQLVRAAFGEDAVVLSTKPCPVGIEVLAMGPEGLAEVQRHHEHSTLYRPHRPRGTHQGPYDLW